MAKRKQIIAKHVLIPVHIKISEKEKAALLEKYQVGLKELPKILKDDPAIENLNAKPGDVIKIVRKSATSGEAIFYRGVTNV